MEFNELWPMMLGIFITFCCLMYVWEFSKSHKRRLHVDLGGIEGFSNPGEGGIETRTDAECYDKFYAKVYDPLVQPGARVAIETQVPLEFLEKQGKVRGDLRIADFGCGTGHHVELFAKQGVRSAVGYDRSPDMIAEAKRKYPERKFEVGDMTQATLCAADQFDLATMYYFTIYMIPDRTAALKNIYLWLSPGGVFCVHIVNKVKFDPILESASPFVGFSVQKYSPERVTKSQVAFEEFDYVGDFQLHGSRGVYEEEFRFKDGRTRRHEQRVWMPPIESLVKEVEAVGFKLLHHVDLTAIGYEYQYLFMFGR